MSRSGIFLCALLLVLFVSLRADWFPEIGSDPTETVVRQTAAGVDFEFFWTPGGAHGRLSKRCGYVLVFHYDKLIWELSLTGYLPGEANVRYGVVPQAYEQTVPRRGPPPPLEFGNKYDVVACVRGTTFIYEGAPRQAK